MGMRVQLGVFIASTEGMHFIRVSNLRAGKKPSDAWRSDAGAYELRRHKKRVHGNDDDDLK